MHDSLWQEFVLVAHQIQVGNQVEKLLRNGAGGLARIKRLGQLTSSKVRAEDYLPWYQHNIFGFCSWDRPGAKPITVGEWAEHYNADDECPGKDVVNDFCEMVPEYLRSLGKILIVHDTMLDTRVIVEGAKRACFYYVAGEDQPPALCFSSPYGHMLFPSDFFVHLPEIKAETPWLEE